MNDGRQQQANDPAAVAAQSHSAADPDSLPTPEVPTNGDERSGDALPPSGPWDPFRLPVIQKERYRIAGQVAQGGGGKILRARDRRLDRPVALKEALSDGSTAEERFVCEALLTARLQHPSIVPVYEAGRWPTGEPFFAMKLVSGRSFAGVIDEAQTFEARLLLLPHVLAVAEAMAYAHSERIIHRDLKPANILVGDFGETVVIDWGLAKDLTPEPFGHSLSLPPGSHPPQSGAPSERGLTLTGSVLGTPAYMPPEQAQGQPVDERADVYALGAILYHVLAGKPPYDSGNSVEDLALVLAGPPPALERFQRAVPEELQAIIVKAMARDPQDRYPTARELSDDLRRFQTGQIVGAHRYSTVQLLARFVRRHRTAVASFLAALVVLVVLGTLSLRRILEARDTAAARQRDAEQAQQQLTGLADGLIVVQARTALEQDPNRAVAWLKRLSATFNDWSAARVIAADAESRGISTVRRGHTRTINALAFSPDGQLIATGSDDRTVRLWDAHTGAHRVFAGHSDEVWRLAFSPDGTMLATGGLDPAIRVWDVSTGSSRIFKGHTGDVIHLGFSRDGHTLFSTSHDGTWHTWDVATGKASITVPSEQRVSRLVFSPDGKYVAGRDTQNDLWLFNVEKGKRERIEMGKLAGRFSLPFSHDGRWMAMVHPDFTVGVWDFASNKGRTFKGHTELVTALAFSPDGKWLASAAPDRTVRLWNLLSGQGRVFEGHIRTISALAFSPDGKRLASASVDHTIHLWDLESGSLRVLLGFDDGVTVLQFAPDGHTLAAGSADNSLRLFHLESQTARILEGHSGDVLVEAVSPDGELLATAGEDPVARLWKLSGGDPVLLKGHEGSILQIAFSPDGRLVATAGADGTLRTWDRSGRADKIFRGHQAAVSSIAFSPDQKLLVSGGQDGTVRLWQLGSGEGQIFSAHEQPVGQVTFTPDGKWIVSGDNDGAVRLGNVDSGEIRVLRGHQQTVLAFGISPDGRVLASGGADRILRLWDIANATGILAVPVGGLGCRRILFTPDGHDIVVFSGDNAAQVLDVQTGAVRKVLRGHEGRVERGGLSPDGQTLATASEDHTVRLWDMHTGESRALRGHTDVVHDVRFSPDGKLVASVGADHSVRLWSDDLPKDPAALRVWLNAATPESIELRTGGTAP